MSTVTETRRDAAPDISPAETVFLRLVDNYMVEGRTKKQAIRKVVVSHRQAYENYLRSYNERHSDVR